MRKLVILVVVGVCVLGAALVAGPPRVLAEVNCGSANSLQIDKQVEGTIDGVRCFSLAIGTGNPILSVKLVPLAGAFDLYLGESYRLDDWNHRLNLYGPIAEQATFALTEPANESYILAIAPRAGTSRYRLSISTGSVTNFSPPNQCPPDSKVCAQTPPLRSRSDFTLSAKPGDHLILPFTTCPGKITAHATWGGQARDLTMLINGPGQTKPYARVSGRSRLTASYTITRADLEKGRRWQVSLVNTSRREATEGVIEVNYPDPRSCEGGLPAESGIVPIEAAANLGGALSSNPAVAAWQAGRLDVFARGADRTLMHRAFDGRWRAWESLGGNLASDPAVVTWGLGHLDVFALDKDKRLIHRWHGDGWSEWSTLGGRLGSPPVAVTWGQGRIDVFALGKDKDLVHIAFDQGWREWESLGGKLSSIPAVVTWGPDRLDVFARGADRGLQHITYDKDRWSGWESLSGKLASDPVAVSWGRGRLDVFARAEDGSLQHIAYDGGRWSGWESLGGKLTSVPTVVTWGRGRLDVFARGVDRALVHRAFDGRWTEWASLSGKLASDPDAITWGPGRIDLFVRDASDALWHRAFSGRYRP